jgi:hypothetical protein
MRSPKEKELEMRVPRMRYFFNVQMSGWFKKKKKNQQKRLDPEKSSQ